MHTLTWRTAASQKKWTFADGLFDLTPHVREEPATVAAAGPSAVLLARDGRSTLRPGAAVRLGPGLLEWRPAAGRPPIALDLEPTWGEPANVVGDDMVAIAPSGEELPLGEAPVIVGRHPSCDLQLHCTRVSTLHCMLVRVEGGVHIVDLGSTNGTFVNGARVASVIVQHARVEIGGEEVQLRSALRPPRRVTLRSRCIRDLDTLVHRVAGADVPVLIEGESGVGKDGLAKRVHELSGRGGPFIPLNAAAISPALAASELFGHVRGAFTGADRDRDGAFLAADGGTLFLDEVAELPLTTQAELLRVVEQRRVRRVGATNELEVDVRLVTATNRDLATLARASEFRADLYHRICVVPLRIPPLRERPDDLHQLAEYFVTALGRELSPAAWEALRRHRWPGNIRELHNVLRRACVVTDDRILEPEHLCLSVDSPRRQMDRLVHDAVIRVYHANDGNIAATARELGIHRATVYRHVRAVRQTDENPAVPLR